MAEIFSLANELLASIFKHLNGIELAIVAQTCQRFRDASLIDQIWQHFCFRGKLYNTVVSSANLESVKEYIGRRRSKRHERNGHRFSSLVYLRGSECDRLNMKTDTIE